MSQNCWLDHSVLGGVFEFKMQDVDNVSDMTALEGTFFQTVQALPILWGNFKKRRIQADLREKGVGAVVPGVLGGSD